MPLTASASGAYAIVGAMLAPALFMAATASLLISANNRLARVVDRLRWLMAERTQASDPVVAAFLEREIPRQRRRSRIILVALRLLYLAQSFFVGTSVAVALDGLLGLHLPLAPTLTAVAGVLALLSASLLMGREVGMAVRALDDELDHLHRRPPGA